MKNVLAFNGSARKTGNTSRLLEAFRTGAEKTGVCFESIDAHKINLEYCNGCLRCNLIKKCAIRGDDWETLSLKIKEADVLVFATPVYFHHVSAQLKKIIDRFRSFVRVQITETGLKHTPHEKWNKDFVLLITLGSSSNEDALPVIDLFRYMVEILGPENRLHVIVGNRLAVSNQVVKTEEELKNLYPKLGLPSSLAKNDFKRNKMLLEDSKRLGQNLMEQT